MAFRLPPDHVDAIRAWGKNIRRDPLTGTIGIDAITQYVISNLDDPDIMRTLEHAKEYFNNRENKKKDLNQTDFSALPMQEHTIWLIKLHFGGLKDADGRMIDSNDENSQQGARQWFHLYAHIKVGPGMEHGDFRMMEEYDAMPTSKQVEDFIRGAMAIPLPVFEPCIPNGLALSSNLSHHVEALRPFLDSFPPPFFWHVFPAEIEEISQEFGYAEDKFKFRQYMKLAQEKKDEGNKAYRVKNCQVAVDCYYEAVDYLDKAVFRLKDGPDDDMIREARGLQAICLANSSISRLLTGRQEDIEKSIAEAQTSIRLDKSYAKGYVRLSRAYEAQGKLVDAEEAIIKALRLPEFKNNQGLVDHLISLQTGGKGLPTDVEHFEKWYKETFSDGQERAKRMKGVGGLWRKICKEHAEKMRSSAALKI